MSSWAGTSRISSDLIKRYIQPKCISDYSRYRNEFVRQIEALSKSNQREFCKRCDIIKKNIKEKDRELNHCYVKNLVTVKLIQNDNIKDFIEECPEIPECNKKYIPSANKGSVLKSGTKEACGRSGCKNERAETVNGKSQLGVDARTPKLESSQREGIVKQSSSHAQGEVTKQTKESPQGQGDIKPPDNLDMTQVKESKQIDNDHSSTNVEEKQLSQPVSASDTLSSSELGIQASDLPSQTSSSGESNSDNTTQVEHLSKGDIQDLHARNHTSDNNNPVRQAAASKIFEDQKAGDRGDVTYIPGRATGDLVSTVPHTAPSTLGDKAPVDVDKDRESPASEDIVTEESGSSVIVDGNSRPDENTEKVAFSENLFDQDTSVFNLIIKYKKYIINAVVPLIIILLLILLMKYTPLGKIFTKIKRKKQNDMNEKLQRVLQQPSNGSEERRIPFSYSAFEYSS
ncbi:hypothetical protein PVIIG_06111 [Plasmodium vivax India VII]|uniref:Variable surface protein Vir18 n=1 Tax=Plasmodium vivax India VII TaxID=1077284 RepID=A0A0J9SHC6_PLAVI|nr:hypothetical protein PVIIG_06111 [Plasmodium vivax India VII]